MLGVVTVELVEERTPFQPANTTEEKVAVDAIFAKIRKFRPGRDIAASKSKENQDEQQPQQEQQQSHTDEDGHSHYLDFVERLLQHEPTERMAAAAALEHPFLQSSLRPHAAATTVHSPTVAQRRQLFQ